ncbi:MAG TPA: cation diffusion facilitator family transporter [Chthoniobacterales bacterium]|nr:cation diffusion facilitator family transporter [Chthoniobacterales bacterium]
MNSQPHATMTNLQIGARLALIGMFVNVAFAVIKIGAGVYGNAYALIADGIESALDVAGSIVIWGGLRFAARPPDATHPYGHGKAEPLAAIFVALGVIVAAIGFAIESTRELFLPQIAPAPFTLFVLILVVIVKETLFRYVMKFGRAIESVAVETDAMRHRADVVSSVAAFIGILVALIGGEKWRTADNWAAIFVCLIIATMGVRLLRPALYDILDTAPRGPIFDLVRASAVAVPGVIEIDKCLVRKMGLEFYVDLHVGVDGNISVRNGHHIAHEVKRAIRERDPRIADVLVHIEPAHQSLPPNESA